MKIDQSLFVQEKEQVVVSNISNSEKARLVFVLGDRLLLKDDWWYKKIRNKYSNACVVSCSATEVIAKSEVFYDCLSATAIEFEKTEIACVEANISSFENSYALGKHLMSSLKLEGLKNILIISDGQLINGSELIRGLKIGKPEEVIVTGGLASDSAKFEKTVVGVNQMPEEGNVVAIGFYGDYLEIGHGSKGGWDSFGPKRLVTKSKANVLFELDGKSALSLYKNYLGDMAKELPGSALLFPLALHVERLDKTLVRTVLNIDEENSSMIFAGDIPEGSYVQLMKANFDRLIDGAYQAANNGLSTINKQNVDLALLISCIGRKLVLGQRVDEEVESVREVIGENAVVSGFYSYGEISPLVDSLDCQLHNQTMTITTFTEV